VGRKLSAELSPPPLPPHEGASSHLRPKKRLAYVSVLTSHTTSLLIYLGTYFREST
jgi:hypothetical protein